jgi:putative ATP-binding cassette transporter
MVVIGRRFITVSENKNQAEAEYRYLLTRLRENGESIALLQALLPPRLDLKSNIQVFETPRQTCL